jgi:hypothetical protein
MNISQFSDYEHADVGKAYTALFELIQSFPEPLRNTWWSGAYRTLDHRTEAEQIAAIKVYSDMATKAHERYIKRVQS